MSQALRARNSSVDLEPETVRVLDHLIGADGAPSHALRVLTWR